MNRSAGSYIVRRLLQLIPLLLGVTLLTFAMLRFAAGDAVELLYENLGTSVSQAVLDAKRAELGLDQPFFVQYGRWLWDLLHGDLGTSYVSGVPVLPTLLSKVPATLLLTGASLGLTILISVPLGIVSAVFHGRWIDYLIRAVSFVGNSLPNFFAALLLLLIFAVKLRWLPVIDLGGGGSLVLPSVTLALAMSSRYTRQIRAAVLEELEQDYVTGALAWAGKPCCFPMCCGRPWVPSSPCWPCRRAASWAVPPLWNPSFYGTVWGNWPWTPSPCGTHRWCWPMSCGRPSSM